MSADFQAGLASGVVATLLGFGCTIVWNLYKQRQRNSERRRAIFRAVLLELRENLDAADKNTKLITEELALLNVDKQSLLPLHPFKHGLWELLKVHLPDELLSDGTTLSALNDATASALYLNEQLRSRQTFKDTQQALEKFSATLRKRDEILQKAVSDFGEQLKKTLAAVENLTREI